MFLNFNFATSQNISNQGINLTGLERSSWQSSEAKISFQELRQDIRHLAKKGFTHIRLPIDIAHHFNAENNQNKKSFEKEFDRLLRLAKRKEINLTLSYFNHNLTHDNYKWKSDEIAGNWLNLLKALEGNTQHIYLDIANEPTLYPQEWEEAATHIIKAVRASYPNIKIIYGSSNYNSIYELSRSKPLPIENLIYSFHFYEPFIFTHQGTSWTGNQNATVGIPFPFNEVNLSKMPQLAEIALGTDGDINYRDYKYTGTYQAINDKIKMISEWATQNDVELWCTEFGVTNNADIDSRKRYLEEVSKTLNTYKIKGFIWEYKGNFGVNQLLRL